MTVSCHKIGTVNKIAGNYSHDSEGMGERRISIRKSDIKLSKMEYLSRLREFVFSAFDSHLQVVSVKIYDIFGRCMRACPLFFVPGGLFSPFMLPEGAGQTLGLLTARHL